MACFTKKLTTISSYALLYFSCFIAQASSKGNPLLDTFLSEDDANAVLNSIQHQTPPSSTTISTDSVVYTSKANSNKQAYIYKRCKECKITMQNRSIQIHMRVVHLSQTFSCPYCPYTIPAVASNMLRHVQDCHGFKGTICTGCGELFSDAYKRNVHQHACNLVIKNYKQLQEIVKKYVIPAAKKTTRKMITKK